MRFFTIHIAIVLISRAWRRSLITLRLRAVARRFITHLSSEAGGDLARCFSRHFVIFAVSAFLSATLSMILNSLKITNAFYAMPRILRLPFKSRVFPLIKSPFIINIIVR